MRPTEKYTDDVKRCMLKMHKDGYTYKEIGAVYGVSRQYIFQLIGGCDKKHFSNIKPEQCIYIGIRDWMNKNRVSITELCRRVYGNSESSSYQRLKAYLSGEHQPRKCNIDKLLEITGLTYEEAFAVKGG